MLELVALQDLTEGDTVRDQFQPHGHVNTAMQIFSLSTMLGLRVKQLTIQMEHDTITGNWMLPRGMFPAKWLL